MKIIKWAIFLFMSLFMIQSHAEKISLTVNIWPPYVDAALEDNGLAMKIVSSAFKQVGYTTNIQIEKWKKTLEGSKLGVYELVGAIWKTPERQKKLLFSDAYLTNNIVLITQANNKMKFKVLEDLQGLLIGVLKDYEYDNEFMKNSKILKFQANRLTQNLISVQQGKLDATVADKRLALYELKHFMADNRDDFRFLARPLSSRKLYIAAPIENSMSKNLIIQFNKGLAAIKKNGTYQNIVDNYHF
jgi:polar amino acid transport system substrate-binding protein